MCLDTTARESVFYTTRLYIFVLQHAGVIDVPQQVVRRGREGDYLPVLQVLHCSRALEDTDALLRQVVYGEQNSKHVHLNIVADNISQTFLHVLRRTSAIAGAVCYDRC